MFPFKDDNPTRRFPILTVLLIVVNVAIYLLEWRLPSGRWAALVENLGVVPARLLGEEGGKGIFSLIASQFLHGGWLHLGGNMLFLWIFGNNVEDHLGRLYFLPFYLASGVVAGLVQALVHPHSHVPTIGASGAIAGVLGAYFMLFPRAKVHTLVILVIFVRVITLPASLWLGLWFVLQLLLALWNVGQDGGTAWFAHLGGFGFGALVIYLTRSLKRQEAPLPGFDARGWFSPDPRS
jgi:membrane associated rhomboid family serine protease